MTDTEIRARILQVAERVVIRRDGEIHAYGRMPNASRPGWYLYGQREQVAREFEAERRPA